MKTLLIAGAAALALGLGGCAGMPGITQGATTKDFLDHMESCQRHYNGTIAATGLTGGFTIDCPVIVPPGSTVAPSSPAK